MDSQMKMNLRAHRQRDYTATESQHPEDFRYSRASYQKEYVSPALQLNSAAKLLAKFLNSINKQLREKIKNDEVDQKAATLQDQLPTQKMNDRDLNMNTGSRKNIGCKKEPKQETIKREKEKKSISGQGTQKETKGAEQVEKGKNSKGNIEALSMTLNPGQPQFYRILAQINPGKGGSGIKGNMEAINKAILQQQSYVNNSQFFKEKQRGQPTPSQARHNSAKGKLFGRSSYHVAIAYHIHLKKIYESGGEMNQMMLDPTYPAKKLKGQQQKQAKE